MQKILTAQQIRSVDQWTIEHEPISSYALMERAAYSCTEWLLANFDDNYQFSVLTGPGNNGGDGLVIARQLAEKERSVRVIQVQGKAVLSDDNKAALKKLIGHPVRVAPLKDVLEEGLMERNEVLIDALFGTGLNRALEDEFSYAVQYINRHTGPVVAIDAPSGLFAEDNSAAGNAIVEAHFTLTFQCPKLSFLLPENARYVGNMVVFEIGLDQKFISSLPCDNLLVEEADIAGELMERGPSSHKGDHGHALLIAGGRGMAGAGLLAAQGCLRSGVGLVTVHVPECNRVVMQLGAPEAMCSVDEHERLHTAVRVPSRTTAIGVGPGIGTDARTADLLKRIIQDHPGPLVIDADALNILSEQRTWSAFLVPNTILTPHPGEFDRLAGPSRSGFERLEKAREMARKNSVFIVLKGAYTAICTPQGTVFFNPTGNAGMAKGGNGDVLTGVLTGLLAQGYSSTQACIIGTYVHGSAGDMAAKNMGMDGMTASDLVEYLPVAWQILRELRERT